MPGERGKRARGARKGSDEWLVDGVSKSTHADPTPEDESAWLNGRTMARKPSEARAKPKRRARSKSRANAAKTSASGAAKPPKKSRPPKKASAKSQRGLEVQELQARVEELAKELKSTEERAKRRERSIRKQLEEVREGNGKRRVAPRKPRS